MEVLFTFAGILIRGNGGEFAALLEEVNGTRRFVLRLDETVAPLVDIAVQYADGTEPYSFPVLHALMIRLLARTGARLDTAPCSRR